MSKSHYLPYFKLVWGQLVWALMLTLIMLLLTRNSQNTAAFAIGSLICWLANGYYAWRVLKVRYARQAGLQLRIFFAGEAEKWFIATGLLVLCLSQHVCAAGPCVLGFILAQQFYWLAPMWLKRYSNKQSIPNRASLY